MLTKQFENGNLKCGSYWSDGKYGPFQLTCVSATGALDEDRWGGGFFTTADTNAAGPADGNATDDGGHNHTIRRIFELRHSNFPTLQPRIITQMQYVGWPDMAEPVNPRSLLRFMKEVDTLVDSANSIGQSDMDTAHQLPTLLHCSAGVGRTGSYIVINAILDGIRREIRKMAAKRATETSASSCATSKNNSDDEGVILRRKRPDYMDVDNSRQASVVSPLTVSDDKLAPPPPLPSNPSLTPKNIPHGLPQAHPGPTVTLHITNASSGGNDIHVPVVPSNTSPRESKTPKPQERGLGIRHPGPPSSVGSSISTSPRKGSSSRYRQTGGNVPRDRRKSIKRLLASSDFTVADADSMFTPNVAPAFAMDVESVRPDTSDQWEANSILTGNSSSGEGTGSGGDQTSGSGSGSGSGPGAAARNAFITPMALALEKMSSSDDIPGPSDRPSYDAYRTLGRTIMRARAGSGSGSGSGEGAVMSSGSSGSRGGYASSSSLGLNTFSTLGLGSGELANSPSPLAIPTNAAVASGDRPADSKPLDSPGLLAPKPVHPLQQPKIIQASLTKRHLTSKTHLSSDSRSSTHSSSSVPSSDALSSLSVASSPPFTSLSETPLSSVEVSSQSSPGARECKSAEEGSAQRVLGYDFVQPRKLNGEGSPPLLSSLEEPIREILEDMREQRMSLCQSLRQYVFVHSAIIEGALAIVDEERKLAGIPDEDEDFDPLKEIPGITVGKRGASPTELQKENKKGEVALAKRPSFRRGKSTSSGDLSASSES